MMFIEQLEKQLSDRKKTNQTGSYTAEMMTGHVDRLLKKIAEEAGEVMLAARNNDTDEITEESADLLFHLLLVLRRYDIPFSAVVDVLKARNA